MTDIFSRFFNPNLLMGREPFYKPETNLINPKEEEESSGDVMPLTVMAVLASSTSVPVPVAVSFTPSAKFQVPFSCYFNIYLYF